MKQRSEDERKRIVKECLRIEKAGGDVLGYLASEHYISPRATWCNIQKYDLHRTILSDGKAVENMSYKKIEITNQELIDRILQGMQEGKAPKETIQEAGYANT